MNKREWKARRWRKRAAVRWCKMAAEIMRREHFPGRQFFVLRPKPSALLAPWNGKADPFYLDDACRR